DFLMERPRVYPNGIAFDAQHRLYWTESAAHRGCSLDDGEAMTFCHLSDDHVPHGMAFLADGRLFVCTTISGGVTVLSPDGQLRRSIQPAPTREGPSCCLVRPRRHLLGRAGEKRGRGRGAGRRRPPARRGDRPVAPGPASTPPGLLPGRPPRTAGSPPLHRRG